MSLYHMTNVPVMDDDHIIAVSIENENVSLWNAKKSDPSNREHWWHIASLYIGDHMFEDDRRDSLRRMYAEDVIFALERGIALGYAKAQADMRQLLGVKP